MLQVIILVGTVCNDDACAKMLADSNIIQSLIELLNGNVFYIYICKKNVFFAWLCKNARSIDFTLALLFMLALESQVINSGGI